MLGAGRKLGEKPHAVTAPQMMPNRSNYFLLSPAPSQGVVLQGPLFQHSDTSALVRKAAQRKDYTQEIQRVELDSIVVTCPESPGSDSLGRGSNVIRRIQSRRRRSLQASSKEVEPLQPGESLTVCEACGKPNQDHGSCQTCGNPPSQDTPPSLTDNAPVKNPHSSLARPPIRLPPSGPNSLQLFKNLYSPSLSLTAPQVDTVMTSPTHVTRGDLVLSNDGTGGVARSTRSRRQQGNNQPESNDTIVLSSDEEAENTGSSGSRMDSVSPRPADSAHSSPAPTGGRVEAAMKDASEREGVTSDYFANVDTRITLPRKLRMKDPVCPVLHSSGNLPDDSGMKRRKVGCVGSAPTCDRMILDCRSVRLGTLRRMVTKPVIFATDYIQIETEAPEEDTLEKVDLRTSELTSCEWCSVRKLPALFLQTTPAECLRLRTQLKMSRDQGGVWYDCKGTDTDEKYIILIFENGPSIQEQVLLEDILREIGRANGLPDIPAKLSFQEANARLVRYNNITREKAGGSGTQTRMSTRIHTATLCSREDKQRDRTELPPASSGPVEKIIVYPPPPAKGGISVTKEDLQCLNTGEFLNDVIIDFYLKYLFLEKLNKEDAQRSHVFSSFFYKRLTQREKRSPTDTTNIPIQKKKHNRVKTWTRHVDLFHKDFIFVPINESAHWYLAVICFPGLEGPQFEPNPLYGASLTGPVLVTSSPEEHRSASRWQETERPFLSRTRQCSRAPHFSTMDTSQDMTMHWNGSCEDGFSVLSRTGGLHRVSTESDDQSSCGDDGSEDGMEEEDGFEPSHATDWGSRPTNCKQPCILIMDSLRGPTRSTVVKTLREYLEVEWEVRKGTKRSFGKEVMRGSSPRVPQQDNFSDCGVYMLQYVESFFKNPIPSFHLPMNLSDWFPQHLVKKKREEVKGLILQIQDQQKRDTQGQWRPAGTDPGSVIWQSS
ncbi:sentrin-specific protease 6 isoform X2 [Megalops cyprinoides]|uniref:sentrin-specific protease 6 isoform X2 n=1 Tax=Megalops cyprinoides TaxID=118141 RepID=UPI0018645F08|nr:sentrin-specific protease 6 isoform X2 [Megalops cyprinoides]